jgi:hypothetical protein
MISSLVSSSMIGPCRIWTTPGICPSSPAEGNRLSIAPWTASGCRPGSPPRAERVHRAVLPLLGEQVPGVQAHIELDHFEAGVAQDALQGQQVASGYPIPQGQHYLYGQKRRLASIPAYVAATATERTRASFQQ